MQCPGFASPFFLHVPLIFDRMNRANKKLAVQTIRSMRMYMLVRMTRKWYTTVLTQERYGSLKRAVSCVLALWGVEDINSFNI